MGVVSEALTVLAILCAFFGGLGLLVWYISKPIPPTEPRHRPYDTKGNRRP